MTARTEKKTVGPLEPLLDAPSVPPPSMGFLEVESFCFGCVDLEKGCRIIAFVSVIYSLMVLGLAVESSDVIGLSAAYLLLFFAMILLYGVIEKVKIVLLVYLLLRAVALVLVLAEIMRNLGRAAGLSRRKEKDEDTENDESVLPVALETGDFCLTMYFWLVVFSFYRSLSLFEANADPRLPLAPREDPSIARRRGVAHPPPPITIPPSPPQSAGLPTSGAPAGPPPQYAAVSTAGGFFAGGSNGGGSGDSNKKTARTPTQTELPPFSLPPRSPRLSPAATAPRPHPRAEGLKYEGRALQTNPFL